MSKPLGEVQQSNRGFEFLEFLDLYGDRCSLQASSLACNDQPGTSAVWLGRAEFKRHHVTGDLMCRMHLDRDLVESLIQHLQGWLDNGTFQLPPATADAPAGA